MVNANRGATGFKSNEFDEEYDGPSKSQVKRDMLALQKLGEQLVAEPKDRIMRVPMPDEVRTAILDSQRIKGHEGRRRQMQFVGKMMRSLNEEQIAAIRKVMDGWKGQSKAETAAMHALERQREKLLANDQALTDLIAQYPAIDAQHLRTLIRNARKEQEQSKPPKAYREIFQILKALQLPSNTVEHDDEHSEENES
jgi:ribosome-associated protein